MNNPSARAQILLNQAAMLLRFQNSDTEIRDILKTIYAVGHSEGTVAGMEEMQRHLDHALTPASTDPVMNQLLVDA